MSLIEERFASLSADHAPGQESRQNALRSDLRGPSIDGVPVDFSHGDVDTTAFEPAPGSFEAFSDGVRRGGSQAYTEYRGSLALRSSLAAQLSRFTGSPISAESELMFTPGSQGALFLAVASSAANGDKVAIVRPDYFANRKIVEFLGAQPIPVEMNYLQGLPGAGLDLSQLEDAFRTGAKTFVFSNPNNPTGVVYSEAEIQAIVGLAARYGVTVIVDQLYSRLVYEGERYVHLRACDIDPSLVMTVMGPSKTESLSGYRLGVAFGSSRLIDRMEKLQAIVSLRAPGYSQAVLRTWFAEPEGWLADRVAKHQAIRDDLVRNIRAIPGTAVRSPSAGSYLFPRLPPLSVPLPTFVRALRQLAGVTVTPGTEFSPDRSDSVRLNFSQNHAAAVHAVGRLAEILGRYRTEASP